jgi:hypothetical protein
LQVPGAKQRWRIVPDVLLALCAFVALAASAAAGPAQKAQASCAPTPLSVEEAHKLLEGLPFVAEDRKRGTQDDFELDHRANVWYVFRVEATPVSPNGSVIAGYDAVNMYTADVVDPIWLCKPEKATKKLVDMQTTLRRSHCLGPAVLKKYRSIKYSCLQ